MNFSFTKEQVQLRVTMRETLVRECPVAALREFHQASAERATASAQRRWDALVALGVPKMLVPTSVGGLGLGDVDVVGVFEEAGWAALPEPLLETAGLAAPILAALLPASPAASGLRKLLTGGAPVAVGGIDVEMSGPTSPTTVSADGMLRTPRVVGARHASVVLLACQDPDSGWQLHAVPSEACHVRAVATLDRSRDLSTVQWPLSSTTLLAYGVAAEASIGLLADRGAAGTAALLVGLANRMITMATHHIEERGPLTPPRGGSPAAARLLARAWIKLEFARPATYRAAWSLATAQPTVSHDASMAKALASDAADEVARAALAVYGVAGFAWESDLPFFVRRTRALCRAWGDAATHRRRALAEAQPRQR